MMIKQIPDEIHTKIMELSATLSSRDIAKKLLDEDDFKISHATINRYLKESRQERAEIYKNKLTESVEKTITNDLEILDNIIETFYTAFKQADDLLTKVKLAKPLTDTIEIKLKNCGSQEQTEPFTWEKYLDENEQEEYLY